MSNHPKRPRSLQHLIDVTRAAIESGELTDEQRAEAEARLKSVEERTEEEFASLDHYIRNMPPAATTDITLIILKGHLLIEQKVHEFIAQRLLSPEALAAARLESHQAICLAEAMALPNEEPKTLFATIKKINALRNKIAHVLDDPGIDNRIRDIVKTYRSSFQDVDDTLYSVLAHCYGQMSELVRLAQRPGFRLPGVAANNQA